MHTRETYIWMIKPIAFGFIAGINEPVAGDVLLNYG
ncbi:hypothetical protein HNQ40_000928 [Algisphaera agarilytica]|uniref:Uncharacterized protein n=1 Tax=Algisphaera agarilytica TaxID=1385975 RepID=A0A7X0LJR6_9BACT|nr:hypothetical protein [Algisphaera agarilytica]